MSGIYADRFLGNNDGNTDIEEIEKLNKEIGSNAGISTFMQMMKEFSYIEGIK